MTGGPTESLDATPAHRDGIAYEQCRADTGDHAEADHPPADSRQLVGAGAGRDQFPSGQGPEVSGEPAPRNADERRGPQGRAALHRVVARREIAFAIVGIANTAMGIGLTVAWLALLGDSVPPSVGVVVAYLTGIGVAFVLHRRLVFRVQGRILRDFLGFAAVNCVGLAANALLLEVAVSLLGFPRALSAVVVMGAVAAGTFFGHQYISFRRPAA
ncbi:GtrA family protein [Nocardia carnea]|uniref:GtrA family protein n=1 Tax=Nocardia carnea TaxID=37328 RepID=UPI0024577D27|nr:GtrA family protein [Nocardia carnea]